MIPSDKELWLRYQGGDKNAFSAIYKRYYSSMYAYGLGMNMPADVVKDSIQEVFYKLYFSHSFEVVGNNLKFYLLRAIRNQLLDVIKLTRETSDIAGYENTFRLNITIEDEMISNEEHAKIKTVVEKMLSRLTDHQKEIIYLRYIEEMSYDDIAELMNVKIQSVRNIVFKAMEKLKELNPEEFMLFFALLMLKF